MEADYAAAEAVIRRLRSVLSARVTGNGQREIQEVHVLIDTERHPKQVGRDIESALLSELGLRVDHRKISIAQVREGEQPLPDRQGRLKFLNLNLTTERQQAEAKVTLGRAELAVAGNSRSQGPQPDPLILIASATLRAAEEYMRTAAFPGQEPPSLELQQATIHSQGGGSQMVLVEVGWTEGGSSQTLLGAAWVSHDLHRTAVYATLDAINRRMSRFVE